MQYFRHFEHVDCIQVVLFDSVMLCGMLCTNECYGMRCKRVAGWCVCGLWSVVIVVCVWGY